MLTNNDLDIFNQIRDPDPSKHVFCKVLQQPILYKTTIWVMVGGGKEDVAAGCLRRVARKAVRGFPILTYCIVNYTLSCYIVLVRRAIY